MKTLDHHLRFSLALALEFEEEGRAESRTPKVRAQAVVIADRVFGLADWLAAWLTGLLVWLNALPSLRSPLGSFRLWWAAERRGWAADLALIAEASRLLLAGRWVFLEAL